MKIVFLADDFPPRSFGGAGISTFELAQGMQKAGHEVFVITTCRKQSDAGESEYRGLNVFTIASDYHERWRAWVSLYNPGVVRQIKKILKTIKPDVVHANNVHYYLSWASLKVAKRYAKRVVWTARDSMAYTYGKAQPGRISWLQNLRRAGKRFNPLRNLSIRYYLSYVDEKCAVSQALADALEQNGVAPVRAIRTAIDTTGWQGALEDVAIFKQKYGLLEKKVVLVAGRLSGGKGEQEVARAFLRVRQQEPNAVLLSVGAPVAGEGVVAVGWIDGKEKVAAYRAADVVWVPSVYLDPFPRVVLEAMAAGIPVIATNLGGASEAVVDGETGFVIDPRDTNLWADKTLELFKNVGKAEAFGRAGLERVKTSFNLNDYVAHCLEIYSIIAKKK